MIQLMIWIWLYFLKAVWGYGTYLFGIATFVTCQYLGFCLLRRLMTQWILLRGLLAFIIALLVWMTGIGIIEMTSDNLGEAQFNLKNHPEAVKA